MIARAHKKEGMSLLQARVQTKDESDRMKVNFCFFVHILERNLVPCLRTEGV